MSIKVQKVYQIRFWLNKISPLICRRFLVNPKTTTIAGLHHLIQLAMNWENFHLHQFTIQGKAYGISYAGGICFGDDPYSITLKDLQLREKERLFYKYNFNIPWEIESRLERLVPMNLKSFYPVCIAGNNIAPSENYNHPINFMVNQPTRFSNGMNYLISGLRKITKKRNISANNIENKLIKISNWIDKYKLFNRKKLNSKLEQYAKSKLSLEDLEEDVYDDEEEVVLC